MELMIFALYLISHEIDRLGEKSIDGRVSCRI